MVVSALSRSSALSLVYCQLTESSHNSCTGTGAVSILFASFPYGHDTHAMNIFSLVFFFLNLFLVILFTALTFARYYLYPYIWPITLNHPVSSLYIGCFPMGVATLINVAVDVINTRYGFGGKVFLYFIWAVWWIDVLVSVLCCWGMVHVMFVELCLSQTLLSELLLQANDSNTLITSYDNSVVATSRYCDRRVVIGGRARWGIAEILSNTCAHFIHDRSILGHCWPFPRTNDAHDIFITAHNLWPTLWSHGTLYLFASWAHGSSWIFGAFDRPELQVIASVSE